MILWSLKCNGSLSYTLFKHIIEQPDKYLQNHSIFEFFVRFSMLRFADPHTKEEADKARDISRDFLLKIINSDHFQQEDVKQVITKYMIHYVQSTMEDPDQQMIQFLMKNYFFLKNQSTILYIMRYMINFLYRKESEEQEFCNEIRSFLSIKMINLIEKLQTNENHINFLSISRALALHELIVHLGLIQEHRELFHNNYKRLLDIIEAALTDQKSSIKILKKISQENFSNEAAFEMFERIFNKRFHTDTSKPSELDPKEMLHWLKIFEQFHDQRKGKKIMKQIEVQIRIYINSLTGDQFKWEVWNCLKMASKCNNLDQTSEFEPIQNKISSLMIPLLPYFLQKWTVIFYIDFFQAEECLQALKECSKIGAFKGLEKLERNVNQQLMTQFDHFKNKIEHLISFLHVQIGWKKMSRPQLMGTLMFIDMYFDVLKQDERAAVIVKKALNKLEDQLLPSHHQERELLIKILDRDKEFINQESNEEIRQMKDQEEIETEIKAML